MQFWKNLNNRGRILLLLMISLVLLNLIVIVTTYNLKGLSKNFTSILEDRLVPSTDLALIQGFCYQNRLYLEGNLVLKESPAISSALIVKNNQQIDSTLSKYKQTYFTKEEGAHVARFSKGLQQYRRHEQEIQQLLSNNDYETARLYFFGASEEAFQEMIEELHLLSGLQLSVGKTLYEYTGHTILLIKTVAYFSLCISIVVAAQVLKVLGIRPPMVSHKG